MAKIVQVQLKNLKRDSTSNPPQANQGTAQPQSQPQPLPGAPRMAPTHLMPQYPTAANVQPGAKPAGYQYAGQPGPSGPRPRLDTPQTAVLGQNGMQYANMPGAQPYQLGNPAMMYANYAPRPGYYIDPNAQNAMGRTQVPPGTTTNPQAGPYIGGTFVGYQGQPQSASHYHPQQQQHMMGAQAANTANPTNQTSAPNSATPNPQQQQQQQQQQQSQQPTSQQQSQQQQYMQNVQQMQKNQQYSAPPQNGHPQDPQALANAYGQQVPRGMVMQGKPYPGTSPQLAGMPGPQPGAQSHGNYPYPATNGQPQMYQVGNGQPIPGTYYAYGPGRPMTQTVGGAPIPQGYNPATASKDGTNPATAPQYMYHPSMAQGLPARGYVPGDYQTNPQQGQPHPQPNQQQQPSQQQNQAQNPSNAAPNHQYPYQNQSGMGQYAQGQMQNQQQGNPQMYGHPGQQQQHQPPQSGAVPGNVQAQHQQHGQYHTNALGQIPQSGQPQQQQQSQHPSQNPQAQAQAQQAAMHQQQQLYQQQLNYQQMMQHQQQQQMNAANMQRNMAMQQSQQQQQQQQQSQSQQPLQQQQLQHQQAQQHALYQHHVQQQLAAQQQANHGQNPAMMVPMQYAQQHAQHPQQQQAQQQSRLPGGMSAVTANLMGMKSVPSAPQQVPINSAQSDVKGGANDGGDKGHTSSGNSEQKQ